jgi:hypothetical protein
MGRRQALLSHAVCYLDLDDRGRYRREADSDGPAAQFATPADPQRPGLLPSVLDPIPHSLMVTPRTLLAALAILVNSQRSSRTGRNQPPTGAARTARS